MTRYTPSGQVTTIPQIQAEFEKIQTAINDTLSRKGDTPNGMEADFDINNNRILNHPAPVNPTDLVRAQDLDGLLPEGGNLLIVSNTENVVLTEAQTVVVFSDVTTTQTAYYVSGVNVDQGRLSPTVDYNVTNSTTITLTSTFPTGTIITAVQNEGAEEVQSDIQVFDNVAVMKAAPLNTGDTALCLRYYAGGDLVGGLLYEVKSSGTTDGYIDHDLANGNKVFLINSQSLHIKQAGAKSDLTTDDTAAIQNAIDYCRSNRIPLVFSCTGGYRITDTIVIPNGTNHIIFEGSSESLSPSTVSTSRGAFVWFGGVNKPAVRVDKQDGTLFSTIRGLTVINSNASTYTGCTGIYFRDETQSGASYRMKGFDLCASGFEIGFRWGNEEGGDGVASSNFDENRYYGLRTFRCGIPFIWDSSDTDNNLFEFLFLEGAYTDLVPAYSTTHKIWLRRAGTNNVMRHVFINASDVATDGEVFDLDDGDWRISDVDGESQDNDIRFLDISSSADRGQTQIENWKCVSTTSSPSMRDTSGVAARINSGSTVTILGCAFDGNVDCLDPVIGINTMFTDDGATKYGYLDNSAGGIIEIGSRTRTSTGTPPSTDVETVISTPKQDNFKFSISENPKYTGNLANSTLENIVEFNLPDDTAIGVKISYFIYGPNISDANRLSERGELFLTAVSDSSGNISSNVTKGSFSQALDGFASLTVSAAVVDDSANNKVTLQVSQTNNAASNSIRGVFNVELSHCLTGGLPDNSFDNINFLSY